MNSAVINDVDFYINQSLLSDQNLPVRDAAIRMKAVSELKRAVLLTIVAL